MNIDNAIVCLKSGEIVIYPTESSYAFGVDAKNKQAIEKLHDIKREPYDKAVPVIASDLDQIINIVELNETAIKLSKDFHPGQLNLIVDFKEGQNCSFLSKNGLCFRIPKNDVALNLCQKFRSPITTTSANIHGSPAIHEISKVRKRFNAEVCTIIDGGDLENNVPASTIYDTRSREILRQGLITKKQIDKVLETNEIS